MTDTDREQINTILVYWFGQLDGPTDVDTSKNALWWAGDPTTDADIRERFGDAVARALDGALDHWAESARGALALVILLDQFTRCLGRGSAEAYVGDAAALCICRGAIERGQDRELRPIERSFLYMPLMHAEDPEVARQSVEAFAELSKEVAGVEGYPDFSSHARGHADIVLRFGRYPHRNELYGRTPTAEEEAFLADGGPTFGQRKR
ncbi:DUF924 family protein [Enhygromyxa salina]|uniref:DUF924 family protein n=1 Tax=Enhygromyxa salina TaxID=215803 RepID=UPI001C6266D7|nr:DUF924 family protein [Enhygromyxa salina]